MIKLFAILTVLASLPVSALAVETSTSNKAIHCAKDGMKSGYTVEPTQDAVQANPGDTLIAR